MTASDHESIREHRTVMLRGEITHETARDCIAQLLFLGVDEPNTPATLCVNSPGGNVCASIAVIRTIGGVRYPLAIHCCGVAGGTAAAIVGHGQPGLRSAVPHAHFAFATTFADPAKGYVEAELVQFDTVLIEIIAEATNKHEREIANLFQIKAALSSVDAVHLGLIDAISPRPLSPTNKPVPPWSNRCRAVACRIVSRIALFFGRTSPV